MSKSKTTRRALFTSATAILLCVVMLVGTTFAWFTDTASTNVNKIQAGTLDIALYSDEACTNKIENNKDDQSAWLTWQKAKEGEGEPVLWEPGCTYELETVYIKNEGDLALKYKIAITGIKGSEKLNEAIEWTIQIDGAGQDLSVYEGHLSAKGGTKDTEKLTIKGHMKETAGNEYKGLAIENVAITVLATQDTVEFDSYNQTYDDGAWTELLMTDNKNGTYTDDAGQLYVKSEGAYVPVTQYADSEGNAVEGRYYDEQNNNYVASDAAIKSVFKDTEAVKNDITLIGNMTYLGEATGTSTNVKNILHLAADTTFDLGGNTLTVNSKNGKDGVYFLGGTSEMNSAGSEAKIVDGTITQDKTTGSSYAVVVAEHTTLTLENVTVIAEDSGYAVRCAGYKDTIVKLNDCTVTGRIMVGSQATLHFNGGCLNGDINAMNNAVVVITSGRFSVKPNTSWLAEGSTLSTEKDSDGYWVVTAAN